jgi:hypothetical protein
MRKHAHRCLALLFAAVALVLPACEGDGHFTLLGYSTLPNYDPNIRTVYVPIFENRTFHRGVEFELTRAVIRAIEQKTPFKVVHRCELADTELLGVIVGWNKGIVNRNQLNEVREAETILTVQVMWRDRRTGEILSAPGQQLGDPVPPAIPAPDAPPGMAGPLQPVAVQAPNAAAPPAGDVLPAPNLVHPPAGHPVHPRAGHPGEAWTIVTSYATFIPELGASRTTSQKDNIDRLATQIVSMMEHAW